MKLKFTKSQSSVKPELVDTTSSKKVVYIHQNIVEIQKDDTTFYEYDEAKLTKDEYKKYLDELKTLDMIEIIENLKSENKSLAEQVDMLTGCILEMSEVVYS